MQILAIFKDSCDIERDEEKRNGFIAIAHVIKDYLPSGEMLSCSEIFDIFCKVNVFVLFLILKSCDIFINHARVSRSLYHLKADVLNEMIFEYVASLMTKIRKEKSFFFIQFHSNKGDFNLSAF